MKLTFKLRFRTQTGQDLSLTGNHPAFGDGKFEAALPLRYLDQDTWSVTVEWPKRSIPDQDIVYNYILRDRDGFLTCDWGRDKIVNPAGFDADEVLIIDNWNDAGAFENAFYTEPFKQVLLRDNHAEVSVAAPETVTHEFKAKAPLLLKGQTLCLLGDRSALRNWNTEAPVLMQRDPGEDYFVAQVDLRRESFPIAYKYGVYDEETGQFLRYEKGENRTLSDTTAPEKLTIVNDGFVALPASTWKGAGVAIPVFSLRSEASFGIGEFTDLKLLVDWARAAGLKLIQMLPINDTTASFTWTDSYPYAAISAFALNPVYLNLSRMAGGKNRPLLQEAEEERRRLNALDVVDYEAVIRMKMRLCKKIFASQKAATLKSAEYRGFFESNRHWLQPYALFCHLRDKYNTSDFSQWPASRRYQAGEAAVLARPDSMAATAVDFHCFLQFHLHLQLKEATDYAHAHGIILKGDVAIGIYRHGADAWQQPELYHMDAQAGAPPDDFAAKGQNWGFPTYNWQRMKEDGYAWWKQRFEQMCHYVDAFRIDHILGFFRIWTVPMHAVEGILGYFVPAIPVRPDEFQPAGIPFDRNRFLKPFITDAVLLEIFGEERETIKRSFLDPEAAGGYRLKPQFATQRQVEKCFGEVVPGTGDEKIREGLYDLISNVLLFEIEGPEGPELHFRLAMEDTSSFKHLEPRVQTRFKALYVDYFYRRQDVFWAKEAMEKLPALKRSTNMLVCGEDLGMVPACVPDVMKQLGLLCLEVQRMPKILGLEFSRPKDAPYLSVVTPSTHDMSTIRGWWEEDSVRTQKFYRIELNGQGDAPATCESWINKAIVMQHLESPAMWSIFQLQDLLGMDEHLRRPNPADERINVPANPRHYWRYRMHLTLETLLQSQAFNDMLKSCIQQSAR